MFDTLDRTGQAEFKFPKAVTFRAVKEAVKALNMKLERADESATRLDVSVGVSAFSWGEHVSISVLSHGPDSSLVSIQSGAKTLLGSATVHGKNRKNVREILGKASDLLAKNGAEWVVEMGGRSTTPVAAASVSVAIELERLVALRDKGALTSAEFETQKTKLLS